MAKTDEEWSAAPGLRFRNEDDIVSQAVTVDTQD
jgi:hypothetical protein